MDLRALQRLEIRDLCYFVALAEELHFSRAAERVGINQSPMSKAIALLEHRLRVRFFHRNRRQTHLTEVGAAFLPQVKAILDAVDRARKDIAAFAAGRKGRLRIGISAGLSVPNIARLLIESQREDSQVEFTFEHRSLSDQLRGLRLDLLDVGLALSLAADPADSDFELQSIPLRRDAMMVAMRADHLLADQGAVRSLEVATGPYLVIGDPALGAGETGKLIEPAPTANPAIEFVPNVDLLLTGVLSGQGLGCTHGRWSCLERRAPSN